MKQLPCGLNEELSMSLPGRILLALCFLLLAPCGRVSVADGSLPNVIVIMADDLGAKELSCYGNGEHRTPSQMMLLLARQGSGLKGSC